MLESIASILSNVADIDPKSITPEHDLIDGLGLSSLDIVNLIVMFEDEFNIEIPDRQIMKFVTVGDVVEYIENNRQ